MTGSDEGHILGELAVERGYITAGQLAEALENQRLLVEQMDLEQTLAQILVGKHWLTPDQAQDLTDAAAVRSGEARLVAGYDVLGKLGEGGMGVVYKARKLDTGEFVALKMLLPSLTTKEHIDRFRRESEVVRRLHHENIVGSVEFGYDERRGLHFCALEFVEGEDLSRRIRREGALPEDEAISITYQIAKALQHAFFNGLIHRDVKPENIMVTSDGTAKLLDLGLARPASQEATRITHSGVFIGSIFYASPEQVKAAKDIDIRGDIYSLGATLYFMLTGHPPFEGGDAMAVLEKHVNEKLSWPGDVNPDVSDGLCLVVTKMMAKAPADRYQTPVDLLRELDRLRAGDSPDVADVADEVMRTSTIAPALVAREPRRRKARATEPRRTRETRRHEAVAPGHRLPQGLPLALAVVGGTLLAALVALILAMALSSEREPIEADVPEIPVAPAPVVRTVARAEEAAAQRQEALPASWEPAAPRREERSVAPPAEETGTAEPGGAVAARTSPSGGGPSPSPAPGASSFDGRRYELCTRRVTWHEAKRLCEERGGHLVTITSAEENGFVASLARAADVGAWIGLTDEQREGVWEWVTREPVTFTAWAPGEPNNSGGAQNCGLLWQERGFAWDDERAAGQFGIPVPFICEWEPGETPVGPAASMAPEGGGWTPILNGRDLTGWRVCDGEADVRDGVLTVGKVTDLYYAAAWKELALDFEVFGGGGRSESVLGLRLCQSAPGRGSSARAAILFHTDGDAHVLAGKERRWRSGTGRFRLDEWVRVKLTLRREALDICRGEDLVGTVDLSDVPLREGGVYFYSCGDHSLRIRNVRVRSGGPGITRRTSGEASTASGLVDFAGGLVGHWDFDEPAGDVAKDSSGEGNHGRIVGAGRVAGRIAGGLFFDGTDDHVLIPNSPSLEDVQEGRFSLAAWLKPKPVPAGGAFGAVVKPGWNPCGLRYLRRGEKPSLAFLWWHGNACVDPWVSAVGPDEFHHVAATVDPEAGAVRVFLNGRQRSGDALPPAASGRDYGAMPWLVGDTAAPALPGGRGPFHGVIDDVRIYDRALSAEEVKALYDLAAEADRRAEEAARREAAERAERELRRRIARQLSPFLELAGSGDYTRARKLAESLVSEEAGEAKEALAAAARVAAALEARRNVMSEAVSERAGEQIDLRMTDGVTKGVVKSVGGDGIVLATRLRQGGSMDVLVPWQKLAYSQRCRFARGWSPGDADGHVALALVTLWGGVQEESREALEAAGDHPLTDLVRARLQGR